MIKEFKQLDQGAFLENLLVELAKHEDLTTQQKNIALDAVNLIKEKRKGIFKGRTFVDGSKQKKI